MGYGRGGRELSVSFCSHYAFSFSTEALLGNAIRVAVVEPDHRTDVSWRVALNAKTIRVSRCLAGRGGWLLLKNEFVSRGG